EEHDQKDDDMKDQPHQEFNTGNNDDEYWHNPEGKPYPHDLSKPLPLILNEQGRQVITLDYFINNDLEYLKGGSLSKKYTTSITKTKAADYGQVKWIEDKLYKFREGDFKRLRRQDIEDMLLLIIQDKLTNLNLKERQNQRDLPMDIPLVSVEVLRKIQYVGWKSCQKILLKLNLPDHRNIERWTWRYLILAV
nr:hypothetical protein [Tanacetum cinerariifolium]